MKNYPLRITKELYEEIIKSAEKDRRSVNKQMGYLLEEALKKEVDKFKSKRK